MEFLYWLESIRNPVLDAVMQTVTHFGSEILFIALGIFMLWCMDKKQGYFILAVGFFGVYINQFLKLICRIPRPWVQDPDFTIVESARADATGYSFPSGHTQTAVGSFFGLFLCRRELWIKITCLSLCLLVPLSRMYLGVHTPLDVGVSALIGVVLALGLWYLFSHLGYTKKLILPLMGSLTLMAVAFLLYAMLWQFPVDIDPHNLASARETACTLLGALIGLWVTYLVDEYKLHFDTQAPLAGQLLKFVIGMALVLLFMEGSKPLFNLIFGEGNYVARVIRYALTVILAGVVWPLTFPAFQKIGAKKEFLA